MNRFLRDVAVATAIMLLSTPSSANVVWTLNNFVFEDGATAVGQFEWNETSNTVVSWDIDVLPVFVDSVDGDSPGNYSNTNSNDMAFTRDSGETYLNFVSNFVDNFTATWEFRIGLNDHDQLDVPVPHLDLTGGSFTGTNGFLECFDCDPYREGQAGAFLTAVPLPGALVLFVTGLFGIGLFNRGWKRTG